MLAAIRDVVELALMNTVGVDRFVVESRGADQLAQCVFLLPCRVGAQRW